MAVTAHISVTYGCKIFFNRTLMILICSFDSRKGVWLYSSDYVKVKKGFNIPNTFELVRNSYFLQEIKSDLDLI